MGNGVASPFDLAAHQRGRIRALERDNRHLEQHRNQLERLLAWTLQIAAGRKCEPLVLLAVLEEVDRRVQADECDWGLSVSDMERVLGKEAA